MAGHSKWANIQHRKKAQDAKRGKIFTRMIREITVAVREGGPDPDSNPRLRLAWDKANAANVPKDNIERAIKKASGDLDGVSYEEIVYEGYAPGGVAVMVECMTDNRNRTVADVRHAFNKHGGNLGTDGSVGYLFDQKGMIRVKADNHDEEDFMLNAIDAGAEEIDTEGEFFNVTTARESMYEVRDELEEMDYEIDSAELIRIPMTEVKVEPDVAESNFKLMAKFEDNDDVSDVFTNMKMDEETLAIGEQMD